MAGLLTLSQSSLFLLPKYRLQSPPAYYLSPPSAAFSHLSGTKSMLSPTFCLQKRLASCGIRAPAVSDSKMPMTIAADSAGGNNADLLPETGGGDSGGADGNKGGCGGGGGGNNNSSDNDNSEESGEGEDPNEHLDEGEIVLFQNMTLVYAFLVGARGINEYLKSGDQKLLMKEVGSTVLLLLVGMFLPVHVRLASTLGFVVSGPKHKEFIERYLDSPKPCPDSVILIFEFVMLCWYFRKFLA